jgi:hypothetical protein
MSSKRASTLSRSVVSVYVPSSLCSRGTGLSKITSLNISLLAQEWSIVRGPPAAPQPLFPLLTSTKRAGVIARNWQRLYRGCQLTNSPNKLTGQPSAPDSGSEDGSKPSSALPRIEAKEPRAKKQTMFGIDQFEPWQSRLNE